MASGSGSGSNHSPRNSMNTYQYQRSVRTVSWNKIVRGESEPSTASPSSPSAVTTITVPSAVEYSSSSFVGLLATPLRTTPSSSTVPAVELEACNSAVQTLEDRDRMNDESTGNVCKKPVWNKPSSGSSTEIEPILSWMGNWPALSESTKSSIKSPSSTELLAKGLNDGPSVSEPVSQGTGIIPFSSHRQVGDDTNINHAVTAMNKPLKRNAPANGSYLQQSPPMGNAATVSLHNSSHKEHSARSGQSHSVNDHPQHQNSFRNRNGGPHQRGDGSHHNYGGKRDQDRGNQDRNTHRNFTRRDSHLQPQGGPRFFRSPACPNSGLFIPPPVRPFGGPMALPAPPLESLRGVPLVRPMPPHQVFVPSPDPLLHGKIVSQIDYYFSSDNLIKDIFLRRNMDNQGWVPADLIARFNKVMQLTDNVLNVPLILEAMKTSPIVEVQGDKLRRRHDWHRWIMPSNVQFSDVAGPQINGMSSDEVLSRQVHRIALEKTTNQNSPQNPVEFQGKTFYDKTSYGDLNSQLQLSGAEGAVRVGIQAGSDHTVSARN